MSSSAYRFELLDGLRGVAALAVVLFHYKEWGPTWLQVPRGYLAVDFFFALSGFVILYSYRAKLLTRMSFAQFLVRRIVRLYPMIFLGVAASAVVAAAAPGGLSVGGLISAALVVPNLASQTDPFPLLPPSWSLFSELAVNLAFAATAFLLTPRRFVLIAAVCAFTLAWFTMRQGDIQFGMSQKTVALGLIRAAFSFSVGALLFFGFRPNETRPSASLGVAAAVLMAAMFGCGSGGPFFDLVSVLIVFPIVLWFCARVKLDGLWSKSAGLLGDLSYPIYVLHFPMKLYGAAIVKRIGLEQAYALPVCIILTIAVSYLALKLYDEPVRAWLSKLHPTAPIAEAAPRA